MALDGAYGVDAVAHRLVELKTICWQSADAPSAQAHHEASAVFGHGS
jgi:hypothetical protein